MNYVGIDLGTTNSAIVTYDGEGLRVIKSPEQHDVTPSALYFDPRGNKYTGVKAYRSAAADPERGALLFKRFMGTSTPINLPKVDKVMTPVECSAEILRTVFGYLPEEVRRDPEIGTVITVPAAFNQMQKDATREASEMAGIGKVALMQEPVAAVMSACHPRAPDGMFMVFDLGGGTLDVAVAESIGGRISILGHGGIPLCGGRDFDRAIWDSVVKSWLVEQFNLPSGFQANPRYQRLVRMGVLAAEDAKIELSARDEATIGLLETDLRIEDESGQEIYLQVPLSRARFESLIKEKLQEAIEAARETLDEAHLTGADIERMVFVGGPTQYAPLRETVCRELGIAPSTAVNPMTAVACGAALFAEAIDWNSATRGRKSVLSAQSAGGQGTNVQFDIRFVARTADLTSRLAVSTKGDSGAAFELQVDSLDTGWSSGRRSFTGAAEMTLNLPKSGTNRFRVFVFDHHGMPIDLDQGVIEIQRTAATVDAIPASHSIAVETRTKVGGPLQLDFLIRAGDPLPTQGRKSFRAEESLRAGSNGSLRIKLWEGEITDRIHENRFVGAIVIRGTELVEGIVSPGDEIWLDYEILDSGTIETKVSIPSIQQEFGGGRRLYLSSIGTQDFTNAAAVLGDHTTTYGERVEDLERAVGKEDERISRARQRVDRAARLSREGHDPESVKQAFDDLEEVRRLLALARLEHGATVRGAELKRLREFSEAVVLPLARPVEIQRFESLLRSASRSAQEGRSDFESYVAEIRTLNFEVLWRQDSFVVDRFRHYEDTRNTFGDPTLAESLLREGRSALDAGSMAELRRVVLELGRMRFTIGADDQMLLEANILTG